LIKFHYYDVSEAAPALWLFAKQNGFAKQCASPTIICVSSETASRAALTTTNERDDELFGGKLFEF
jgi:hypothetical protein